MIYLDNAATTRVDTETNDVIAKYNSELYFNPSALYSVSGDIKIELDGVRDKIKNMLGASRDSRVIFTGGATEASNLAIFGSVVRRGKSYVFSEGEHPSVHNCALELIRRGVDVSSIPLDKSTGEVDYDKLDEIIDDNVGFVSVMLVSNETGAINDIPRVVKIVRKHSPTAIIHVDAVQGFCKIPFNMASSGVDLCSISAHKIYGPKGVGALVVRPNLTIKNIVFGGGQEKGIRSGTENISGIMALGNVIKNYDYDYIKGLKDTFIRGLSSVADKIRINGNGSPYILSISIDGIRGETLVHSLEQYGIIIGTGSACSSSKIENRVLNNMGRSKSEILGSVRISFGKNNTADEVEYASKMFCVEVNKLLDMNKR